MTATPIFDALLSELGTTWQPHDDGVIAGVLTEPAETADEHPVDAIPVAVGV